MLNITLKSFNITTLFSSINEVITKGNMVAELGEEDGMLFAEVDDNKFLSYPKQGLDVHIQSNRIILTSAPIEDDQITQFVGKFLKLMSLVSTSKLIAYGYNTDYEVVSDKIIEWEKMYSSEFLEKVKDGKNLLNTNFNLTFNIGDQDKMSFGLIPHPTDQLRALIHFNLENREGKFKDETVTIQELKSFFTECEVTIHKVLD